MVDNKIFRQPVTQDLFNGFKAPIYKGTADNSLNVKGFGTLLGGGAGLPINRDSNTFKLLYKAIDKDNNGVTFDEVLKFDMNKDNQIDDRDADILFSKLKVDKSKIINKKNEQPDFNELIKLMYGVADYIGINKTSLNFAILKDSALKIFE